MLDKEQWFEFVKCLDLFCQEVISRQELLDLVKDLFEDENLEIYDQFTQVLTDRGVVENPMEEVWFSMPLSEIDFSQCRKCTPSYRALPSGYPIPPCSERSSMEQSVLNDNWVSVPTGSEDFAFKNARKNVYEEQLFKCGDDRFEIDMVIESNASTIRLLEPLAKEIETLRKDKSSPFQFRLDRRTLSVNHLKAIARIYGEHGAEILELLRKTPAGAIPVILKRLKQKDVLWRKEKRDLEVIWKEQTEKNASKSREHENQHFRQHGKKRFGEKTLLQEAKMRFEKTKRKMKRAIEEMQQNNSNKMFTRKGLPEIMAEAHLSFQFKDVSIHRDLYVVFLIDGILMFQSRDPINIRRTSHTRSTRESLKKMNKSTLENTYSNRYVMMSLAIETNTLMSEDEKKMCLDSHKSFLSSLFLFEDDAKIFDDDFTKDVMEKSQEPRLEKGTSKYHPLEIFSLTYTNSIQNNRYQSKHTVRRRHDLKVPSVQRYVRCRALVRTRVYRC